MHEVLSAEHVATKEMNKACALDSLYTSDVDK